MAKTTGSKSPIITTRVVVVDESGNQFPFHPDLLLPRSGTGSQADAEERQAPETRFDWPDT